MRQLLAEEFDSFADMEGGILASSALPFIIGDPFFHYWRGYRCLDGRSAPHFSLPSRCRIETCGVPVSQVV